MNKYKQKEYKVESKRPRRGNAGVGFFAIAREEKLARMKKKKPDISAKKA